MRYLRRNGIVVRGLMVAAAVGALCCVSSHAGASDAPQQVSAVKLLSLAGGGSEVWIGTSGRPEFSARVAQEGKRILVDISGAVVAGAPAAITDPAGVVGGIMTQTFDTRSGKTTRVLIQLLRNASYRVATSDDGLRLVLEPADETKAARAEPSAADAASATPSDADGAVQDVKFERRGDQEIVRVSLRGDSAFNQHSRGPGRTLLELTAASLPKALQRTIDVAAFGGSVRAISSYARDGKVMIDVDHGGALTAKVEREDDALVLVFSPSAAAQPEQPASHKPPAPKGGPAVRLTKHLDGRLDDAPAEGLTAIDRGLAELSGEWTSEPDVAGAFGPTTTPQQARRFTGRRVDLDLKDADIHNVFRIIADVGRVNIVAADNVKGEVTIRMKNVPWDQALDTILQAKSLGMVRKGNIIRVALMADLNKERELAIERRKSELQLAPIETRLIPVSYATADEMAARAQEMLSPRGTISVDDRTNVLITRDVAGNLNQIEELIRALDTQTPQVLIEARIVEATSRFQRDVGIQWGGYASIGPATGNETGLAFPSSIGIGGGASDANTPSAGLSPDINRIPNPNFAVNLPATVGTGAGGALGLNFGSIDNSVNLAVRLSAAEATGMLRIVSSPRILTLDNAEARINQGTLIPFSQVSAQGVQTVFQEAKLQLLVVPHVTADGSVSMHVKINRDEPDFNQTSARGDPTILKREAETDLLVPDGHTAVIGGIYSRNTGRNLDQVPLLGDIPILGVLFQRRRSSDTRSELVIFITPRIVNRAEALGR